MGMIESQLLMRSLCKQGLTNQSRLILFYKNPLVQDIKELSEKQILFLYKVLVH